MQIDRSSKSKSIEKLQKQFNVQPLMQQTDFWLSLPRVFHRSSARFELPIDSRELETMSPLEYIQNYVVISSPRKLLYNCIFNKFKIINDEDNTVESFEERKMMGCVGTKLI